MEKLFSLFPAESQAWHAARALDLRTEFPPLLAGEPYDLSLVERLQNTTGPALFAPNPVIDKNMAEGVRAGLLLANDAFEASHHAAQGINTPEGSYWHALCHRREGSRGEGLRSNLNNARYWYRKVGSHPVFAHLAAQVRPRLAESSIALPGLALLKDVAPWDPLLMVECCWEVEKGRSEGEQEASEVDRAILREIQWQEIRLLLEYCAVASLAGAQPANQ